MENASRREFVGLRGESVLHKPVSVQVNAAAGIFRQGWLQRENAAEPVGAFLKVGIAEYQIVLNETGKSLLAEQAVRDIGAAENVALNGNR